MGKLKKHWKRGRGWLVILTVLILSISVSGCTGESSSQEQNTKKQTEEQNKDKKEQAKEGEDVDGNNEAEAEEDGVAYADNSSAGSKSQGGNQTASGNGGAASGGTGSSGNSSQKHTVSIQFSVDSSNADGSVSYGSAMTLPEGATVYDALAATGLSYTGYGYIEEIGGLWEKDFSAKSGWKYYVNGSAPMMSCADYVLKDGDSVQWVYVLNP